LGATKSGVLPIRILGYLVLAAGLGGMAIDYIARLQYSAPQNMGIVLGNSALALVGCVTWALATALQKVERRLDELEQSRQAPAADAAR
jgi:hypothetical protein